MINKKFKSPLIMKKVKIESLDKIPRLPKTFTLYRPFGSEAEIRCIMEMKMLNMSQQIRSKPNWYEKIMDPEIVSKWKSEAEKNDMVPEAIEYVIEEVKYYASIREGCVEPGPVDKTWIADGLIRDEFLGKLNEIVAKLEDVPVEKKDYHPGSDDLVLDLVHPSLYCFVENHSVLINENIIDEDVMPFKKISRSIEIDHEEVIIPTSAYRWLPAEVSCDEDGKITFDSYINNLHPKQFDYKIIADILQEFIPMFNKTLNDVIVDKKTRINLSNYKYYEVSSYFDDEDYSNDEACEAALEKWESERVFLPLPISTFEKPQEPKTKIDLKGKKLQVIVKLANIELTPEKPKYNGGTWHVEGIDEERVVATGIYYYDIENITESNLLFRESCNEPMNYKQNDLFGVEKIYGLTNETDLNQIVGCLTAQKGRCVVFPNTYQHCVAPFELVDKKKIGHRKILVFFLVDPTISIISTLNVLPQQPDWDDIRTDMPSKIMTREIAEEMREKLMFERKYFRDNIENMFYLRECFLCEH